MKNPSIGNNYLYNTGFQILTILIPFITTPYVSRCLSPIGVGQYSFSNAIATYFIVFATFGSTLFGQRGIAFHRDNKNNLSSTFINILSFRLISTTIALLAYFAYLHINNALNLLNIIISLNIVNVSLDITWYYQGLEFFKKIVFRNLTIKILGLISVFLFVKKPEDVWIYALVLSAATIFGNLSMWFGINRNISFNSKPHPFEDFKGMLYVFLPTIAVELYTILDKSMIGWISESNYALGCYEQAEKLEKVALSFVISAGTVILPRIANLYAKNDKKELKKYIYVSYRYTLFTSVPMIFSIVAIAPVFIPYYLGEGYDYAIILLQLLSVLLFLVGLAYTTGYVYLIPTKQQNVYTFSVTLAAIINLFFNIYLVRNYSAVGAAIATIIAEFVGCLLQITYCCKTGQLEFRNIFRSFWKYLIAGVIMFMVMCLLRGTGFHSLLKIVLMLILGVLTYSIMLFFLKDEFFNSNIEKVLKNKKLL